MILGFEHIGTTSANIDRTIDFYSGFFGLTLAMRKVTERGEIAYLDMGNGMLEVFCPRADIDRSRDVPPHEAGMRHLAFAVTSVDALIEKLEAAGVEILMHPRPAIFTEMLHRVGIVRDPDGIVVELLERAPGR